jgi:hypothetical protein
MAKLTTYERAQIRLRAFELLDGWGDKSSTPDAKDLVDRLPVPWGLEVRKRYAKELAEWAEMDDDEVPT